jgi:hypothetical protein
MERAATLGGSVAAAEFVLEGHAIDKVGGPKNEVMAQWNVRRPRICTGLHEDINHYQKPLN